jgi:putative FmdB family regulatory protein
MPIYEYRCKKCGHVFDKFVRSMSATGEVECPECHSQECRKNVTVFGSMSGATSVSAASDCAPKGG